MVAARLPTMLPTQLGARLGPFSTGNGRDPNYVYNADELDTLLQDNGVAANDVVSTTDTIWAALLYADADAFWDDMYTNGILKQDIIDEIPSGPTFIFNENFDSVGFDETGWTILNGAPNTDEDSTLNFYTSPYGLLMGAFSKLQSRSGIGLSSGTFRLTGYITSDPGNEDNFLNFYDSGASRVFRVMIRPGGNLEVNNADGSGAYVIGTYTINTRFFLWLDWDAATSTVEAYYSTTTTKPGSPSVTRNVGSSSVIDYFIVGDNVSSTFAGTLDQMQAANSILGDF
jgi:hypothetical protein